MATTIERPRAKPARAATKKRTPRKGQTPAKKTVPPSSVKQAAKPAKKVATKAGKALVKNSPSPTSKLTRKVASKGVGLVARKALASGVRALENAIERTAGLGLEVGESFAKKQPPIQRSLDVAVPIRVAWDEWMALESLPEGLHHVADLERDGDGWLSGRLVPSGHQWEAEVLDERPEASFAWQSVTGSDCAGLITFHRLSDRLTRLELNLDVAPTSMSEALALATKLADRRAEADLRRFKARVELINPDLYEDDNPNGG
jgi:uncharacterized membrane protein